MYSSIACLMGQSTFEQFCKMAAVLERFVAAAPRPASLDGIALDLDMDPLEVRTACHLLQDAGLLCPAEGYEHWVLTKPENAVTLEDVWSSLSLQGEPENRSTHLEDAACLAHETGLLVTQAFMELQQCIRNLLRQFQLDRVSVSKSGGMACFSRSRRYIRPEEETVES